MVLIDIPNDDDSPLGFGKHIGKTPAQVADIEPSYIVWLYESINPKRCSRELYMQCSDHDDDYDAEQDLRALYETFDDR